MKLKTKAEQETHKLKKFLNLLEDENYKTYDVAKDFGNIHPLNN